MLFPFALKKQQLKIHEHVLEMINLMLIMDDGFALFLLVSQVDSRLLTYLS